MVNYCPTATCAVKLIYDAQINLSEVAVTSLLCLCSKKSEDGTVKSLPRPSTESDIWVPDHLTPSWVCLPNDQPVLTIIQPGESVLCVLETICKVTTHVSQE